MMKISQSRIYRGKSIIGKAALPLRHSQLSASYTSMYRHASSYPVSHSPTDSHMISILKHENAWLRQKVVRLHRQLETTESILKAVYHEKQFKRSTCTSAKISRQSQIMQRSRSLDSIH